MRRAVKSGTGFTLADVNKTVGAMIACADRSKAPRRLLLGGGSHDRLLQSLGAAGVQPEEVTDILLTHAHDDRMGPAKSGNESTFAITDLLTVTSVRKRTLAV